MVFFQLAHLPKSQWDFEERRIKRLLGKLDQLYFDDTRSLLAGPVPKQNLAPVRLRNLYWENGRFELDVYRSLSVGCGFGKCHYHSIAVKRLTILAQDQIDIPAIYHLG